MQGITSNWLCDLRQGDRREVTGPFGATFLVPDDPDADLLMICTGTGVAPFRGFTHWRRRVAPNTRGSDHLALRAGFWEARLLLGGAAMDGPRYLFWNFVSSSRHRIEQAKADWRTGRLGKVPDDEKESIPLPERVTVQAGIYPSEPGQVSEGSPTS